MKALLLNDIQPLNESSQPLSFADVPMPEPSEDEVLIKVNVCGVCHTELDEIEGRTSPSRLPMVLGHQVVGRIVKKGSSVTGFSDGDKVGVAWIYSSCKNCEYCRNGNENLCDEFRATGRDAFGGYAEYLVAPASNTHRIPAFYTDAESAPLLCAGAVGYRSLKLTGLKNGEILGLTGFGASAHLVLKLCKYLFPDSQIYVFARKESEQQFALELGAGWAGNIGERSPEKCHAIIDTTPVWKPVVEALADLKKGGKLIINAIRKEDTDKEYLQHLSYKEHLWHEKMIRSVANVTVQDVEEFLDLAAKAEIKPHVQEYAMKDANKALTDMKFRKIKGAKVLRISS